MRGKITIDMAMDGGCLVQTVNPLIQHVDSKVFRNLKECADFVQDELKRMKESEPGKILQMQGKEM